MGDIELTSAELDELERLARSATPVERSDLMQYEHGGGRLAIIRDGKRDLIADFYGDGADRDFYASANPATILRLISLARSGLEARKAEESMRERVLGAIREWDQAEYTGDYEFRGDGDYTPNDDERALIIDAVAGAVAEIEDAICALPLTEGGDTP